MEKVRRDTNFIVLGLVLYTLLRYVIFALEPLARVCFVRLVCSDSAERTVLLQQLEENAANSGVSSIVAVLAGVLFLGWYFRRDTPPRMVFQKKQPLPWKRLPLLICIFMGAQLIYSLFGNVLEFLLRLCGYTAMGQLNAASAQSTTVSMFLYTAVFAPVGEELIYRGLVMRQFQKYGNVFAIVVSAALFGVMHANLFQMIFAFLTGLVLGYMAAEFSLRWSIVLHLVNNLVFGELLGWLMGYLSPAEQDYLYRGINIFFFAFAAFWLLHHRKQLGHYLQQNRCAKKCYAAAFTAVAMVTFFVGNFGLAISGIQKR